MKTLSDAVLINQYQKGETKAVTALVQRWHLQFIKLAFWIIKDIDAAKDIAQESWTIIFNKLDDLHEPNKFKSWAIRIVKTKSIDWVRARNREYYKLIQYHNTIKIKDYEPQADDLNIHNKLLKAIKTLSQEHQIVLQLFYRENYTLKEISSFLNISLGTTKSRLFYAREKLKNNFKTIKL